MTEFGGDRRDSRSPVTALPLNRCPACHSQAARPLRIGGHVLKKCAHCRLVYASAYMAPETIYVDGYFAGEVGDFGMDLRHPEWEIYLEYVARCRLDMLENVVRPAGRILDVGCGPGHLLAEAGRRGWEPKGVDLVADAVHTAVAREGLDVRCATLEDSGFPERSFDVVVATHVLEHQPDAIEFLTSIGRWVKPGGYVFIEVPNWMSTDRWGNRDRWYGLRPLEHVAHYSPRTLARTMERVGFEPIAVHTPSYQFERQSLGQALHDFGLERLVPYVEKNAFTVQGIQRGEAVRLPNAFARRVLSGMERIGEATKSGVVICLIARVL
jgi:2-polyprenyl-3-methyl-5-hydroxy-6-metoxy-1,4-benzoquinol methylase